MPSANTFVYGVYHFKNGYFFPHVLSKVTNVLYETPSNSGLDPFADGLLRTSGECIICDRHLCATHLEPESHTCPKWEVSKTAVSYRSLEGINQIFTHTSISTCLVILLSGVLSQ